MEKIDKERGLVCEAMGAKYISAIEWMKNTYGTEGKTLREHLQTNEGYKGIVGPNTINHRYIYDDLLTGLVPIYKTGKKHNVKLPITKAFIDFAKKSGAKSDLLEMVDSINENLIKKHYGKRSKSKRNNNHL